MWKPGTTVMNNWNIDLATVDQLGVLVSRDKRLEASLGDLNGEVTISRLSRKLSLGLFGNEFKADLCQR